MSELAKILKVLKDKDNDFKLRHLKDTNDCIVYGLISYREDGGYTIFLNVIDIVLPVLTHELLHGVYPEKGERQIEKEAKEIVGNLTRRQRRKMFLEWACRISEKEEKEV